jgi:recombination associated protein RdgC
MYRFPSSLVTTALAAGLEECALRPVGPMELSTRGFVSPYGRTAPDALCAAFPGLDATLLSVGTQTRALPSSTIEEKLAERCADIEKKSGYRPGGRTRKRLKDELITELLPQAFVKHGCTDAILDEKTGVLFVDAASRKAADAVVSEIRRALGSFPALPLNAEVAPRSVLTEWVARESMPDGLSLGDEVELRDAFDGGAVVKCSRMEIGGSDEIARHLESGKQVTRLALELDGRLSFVVGEDLSVRKVKFLDAALESLENMEREDMRAEVDARFALQVGEFRRLFAVLESAFRISAP